MLQVPTLQGELERFRPLLTRAFGPALPQVSETEGEVVHGGRLVWSASMGGLEPRTTDGHPLLVVYGLWSASQGFFYQPTAIDTVTGEVWQGKSQAAAGAGPITFFGPLLPPREARLAGFGLDELGGVDAILRQRVGARAP